MKTKNDDIDDYDGNYDDNEDDDVVNDDDEEGVRNCQGDGDCFLSPFLTSLDFDRLYFFF